MPRDTRSVLEIDRYDRGEFEDVTRTNPLPVEAIAQVNDITGTTKQVSVGTSATLIAEANPHRTEIMLTGITGSQITYIGFTSGVTSTTGVYMAAAAGTSLTLYCSSAIWGIAAVSAQTLSVLEESRNTV